MSNIRILAQTVLKIGFFSFAIMKESKKGHNFAILGLTKKMFLLIFYTDATYKISNS